TGNEDKQESSYQDSFHCESLRSLRLGSRPEGTYITILIIDECAECCGKPWSDEFLSAKEEIENSPPQSIHGDVKSYSPCPVVFVADSALSRWQHVSGHSHHWNG